MSKMKFSVFTVMIPELGFEETAELVKQAGYDGIEWRIGLGHVRRPIETPTKLAKGVTGDYTYWEKVKEEIPLEALIENAPRLRRLAETNGLELPALITYLKIGHTPNLLQQIRQVCQACQMMGCPQFRVQVPNYDRSQNYNELFDFTLKELEKIQDIAREYQVRVNIEIHADCITPSAGLAHRIVQNFDPRHIGVIFDPGNMIREGMENWLLGMQLLGEYLAHVHVKNAGWAPKENLPTGTRWEPSWMPLQEGMASWGQLLADLKQVGYQGWLSLEDFSAQATEEKLVEDLKYLKRLEAAL
jgi:sugar phosphate isomerase/epimerase